MPNGAADPLARIFTAIQEQLGLKVDLNAGPFPCSSSIRRDAFGKLAALSSSGSHSGGTGTRNSKCNTAVFHRRSATVLTIAGRTGPVRIRDRS